MLLPKHCKISNTNNWYREAGEQTVSIPSKPTISSRQGTIQKPSWLITCKTAIYFRSYTLSKKLIRNLQCKNLSMNKSISSPIFLARHNSEYCMVNNMWTNNQFQVLFSWQVTISSPACLLTCETTINFRSYFLGKAQFRILHG